MVIMILHPKANKKVSNPRKLVLIFHDHLVQLMIVYRYLKRLICPNYNTSESISGFSQI